MNIAMVTLFFPLAVTMCLRVLSKSLLNSGSLGVMTTSLGSLFQCLTNLRVKNLFLIPSLDLPWHNFMLFLGPYHWSPERRDECLPLLFPSWGSCRPPGGVPSVSSSLGWTNQGISAAPPTASSADPLPGLTTWCRKHKEDLVQQAQALHTRLCTLGLCFCSSVPQQPFPALQRNLISIGWSVLWL